MKTILTAGKKTEEVAERPPAIPWAEFLEEYPPGSFVDVSGADTISSDDISNLFAPALQLHCPQPTCNGRMFFETNDGGDWLSFSEWRNVYLTYWCRNCRKTSKIFSLCIKLKKSGLCEAYKFGELPSFGPPVPSRVLRLIQPDRELFLRGRRCENQGLGIGAFTYYRRVVEDQWTRLIDEIIKVAKVLGTSEETLEVLESAKNQQQFSKSIKEIKDAIPPVLLIKGHNPLLLLHGALSQGVHDLPDEECLSLATSIRAILVDLAEKLGEALRNEKELTSAVSRLLKVQEEKAKKDETDKGEEVNS
ncbi:MAG: hypothetical protein JXA50_01535 [Deltaproteobacteria bacterium]|nr:hypothetical protein [Deltaproteobacteria bacterium]